MPPETTTTGVASIQTARREMYRQQILTAAEHEFSKAGFAGARMSAIARTAGVSLDTVYKTFSGKAAIWDAVHHDRIEALMVAVDIAVSDAPSPLERLLSGVAAAARFLAESEAYLELNLTVESGWASVGDAGHGAQRTVWSAGLDMVAAGVEAAIEDGTIGDIRPRVAAGLIVSAMQVWLADWVSSGRDREPEVVIAAMMRHLRWLLVGPST